jgi:hypothetical protein
MSVSRQLPSEAELLIMTVEAMLGSALNPELSYSMEDFAVDFPAISEHLKNMELTQFQLWVMQDIIIPQIRAIMLLIEQDLIVQEAETILHEAS